MNDARRCDAFNAGVEEYLGVSGSGRKAVASVFWAAFEDFRSCYYTYAPDFIPPLTDEMSPSLASYYLYRQKLHTLLEAGSEACAGVVAETRATWTAHEICYEQFLRSRGRDSVAWLGTFSANLQDATRVRVLKLVQQHYPDTHQLAAACVSDDSDTVAVAEEFWAALPLEHMSDEEIRTIEQQIVDLYADTRADGRRYRGALAVAMDAARPAKPATAPKPDAAMPSAAVVATPPTTNEIGASARSCHVAPRPAAIQSRGQSRASRARRSHGHMRSRSRRPRPRHSSSGRRPRSRRSRSRRPRSRRRRSRSPRRVSAGALRLRPRARSSYCRRTYR